MFNTTEGATSLADSKPLRRAALLQKTPYYTTLSGAIAAAEGIKRAWPANSKSGRCRTIWRDGATRRRRGNLLFDG